MTVDPYKCIVSRNDRHDIDSLLLKLLILLNKRRQMLDLTSRRKSPRNSKQNDLLPFKFLHSVLSMIILMEQVSPSRNPSALKLGELEILPRESCNFRDSRRQ